MNTVIAEFCHRVEGIPFHGVGLSTNAYQPDFVELMAALRRRKCPPDFTELFRASTAMLAALRRCFPDLPMPYHAEGLWFTQPGWAGGEDLPSDLELAAEQVRTLGGAWLNHECASKVLAGYPVGTYLPPVFSTAVAELVAGHAAIVQEVLDQTERGAGGTGPLLLLELPPLTYFGAGNVSVPEFFRHVADRVPCGLALDIGHLWTHYRYGVHQGGESLEQFLRQFLDVFPLERVVEIHVAGLTEHPAANSCFPDARPLWLDAHGAPIPAVLFDMLDQVLDHSRLRAIKGVALEIDTKPVEVIVDEFETFSRRYRHRLAQGRRTGSTRTPDCAWVGQYQRPISRSTAVEVGLIEEWYVNVILGRARSDEWGAVTVSDPRYLAMYREQYLPNELLHWGGDLLDMFPRTCARLTESGIALDAFVRFWFSRRRLLPAPFDFFTLKIDWFVQFVQEHQPETLSLVVSEAEILRSAYDQANAPVEVTLEVSR